VICPVLSLLLFWNAGSVFSEEEVTLQQADRELNAAYQQALRELDPPDRERLRKAERAWVAFAEKNAKAMRLAATALHIPSKTCTEIEVAEISQRSADFNYSVANQNDDYDQASFARVDGDLNAVYRRCISALPDPAKAALRDAQRAWIEYRDANRVFGMEFIAGLTSRRADQLTAFYISGTTLVSPAASKLEHSSPDPFETAR
jgi:uncharacterized protein YecT (DUF1311 family)